MEVAVLEKLSATLNEGKSVRQLSLTEEEAETIKELGLLTSKPIIYAANVSEDELATGNEWVEVRAGKCSSCVVSAQVESELVELREDRASWHLWAWKKAVKILDPLMNCWACVPGLLQPQGNPRLDDYSWDDSATGCGVIHSDFERGFIRAETVAYDALRWFECEKKKG